MHADVRELDRGRRPGDLPPELSENVDHAGMIPRMSYRLVPLPAARVREAFDVLQLVAAKIAQAGRQQRISKTSFTTYESWQVDGVNYVVMEQDTIVGLVTLRKESLDDWPDVSEPAPVWMLRALATHPDSSGRGVGAFAVQQAVELLDDRATVYLDCVSGFLPDYYQSLGFEPVARRDYRDDDGDIYDITLMRHRRQC